MEYATSYDVGDRKRARGINEDSVAVSVFEQGHREGLVTTADGETDPPATRSSAVFALADGAGGHEAGDVASYIASTVVSEHLAGTAIAAARSDPAPFDVSLADPPEQPTDDDMQAAIGEAVVTAHRAILEEAKAAGTGAYTTVVAGIAVGGSLHLGWVGDSRAYIVNREREEIARLTRDHAVVEQLQERDELDDVEAHVHPRGNEITRALGGTGDEDPEQATVEVDTRTVPLFAEDVVLVTSDGLIDAQTDAPALYDAYVESGRDEAVGADVRESVVTDDEIRDVVLEAPSLEVAAERFVELANERGGKDNVSTVLCRDSTLPPTPDDDLQRDVAADGPIEKWETIIVSED